MILDAQKGQRLMRPAQMANGGLAWTRKAA